jgi:riboflavin synthase
MFTGIIEERGEILAIEHTADAARLTLRAPLTVQDARHGDSIAVNGVCLTVVEQSEERFTADVMAETLAVSTLAHAAVGDAVNLERAMQIGDRLGGHIVQGHVDGTATVLAVTHGERWRVVRFDLPPELAALVVRKGSIALDGVSLTVSAVSEADAAEPWFEVSLIPETIAATTLGLVGVGDRVNVETDILARHVERMLAIASRTPGRPGEEHDDHAPGRHRYAAATPASATEVGA